jgi:hypothetical protein
MTGGVLTELLNGSCRVADAGLIMELLDASCRVADEVTSCCAADKLLPLGLHGREQQQKP